MILFLTSSPTGCPFDPGPEIPVLDQRNQFVQKLRAHYPAHPPRCLMLAGDPYAFAQNDHTRAVFDACFAQAGMPFAQSVICDARNQEDIASLVAGSSFLILHGGHVPTQNAFFSRIGLPALLQGFEGGVLGISAGSMNAAGVVYAPPEEPGEAADPHYSHWYTGLGLTDLSIYPHWQRTREQWLDGRPQFEIALADSYHRPFFALPDGSYILTEDGVTHLYGAAWWLEDGRCEQISEEGDVLTLR